MTLPFALLLAVAPSAPAVDFGALSVPRFVKANHLSPADERIVAEQRRVREIVARTKSAVVTLQIRGAEARERRKGAPLDQTLEDLLGQLPSRDGKPKAPPPPDAVVSLGSGFVADAGRGWIVTNQHVIEDLRDGGTIDVVMSNGDKRPGKVLASDPVNDVAVVQVRAPGLVAAPLGDSDQVVEGDRLIVFGSPQGFRNSVTFGHVSAVRRNVPGASASMAGVIQTDAAINHGNSGGIVVDFPDGHVVGMPTIIYSESGGSQGLGFAVPINKIKVMLERLRATGKLGTPRLGITLENARGGAEVKKVEPGTAAAGRLKAGDVIVEADGVRLLADEAAATLQGIIASKPAGAGARLRLKRGSERLDVSVVPR